MTEIEQTLRAALNEAAAHIPLSPQPLAEHQRRRSQRSRLRRPGLALPVTAAVATVVALIVVGAVIFSRGSSGASHPTTLADSESVALTPGSSLSAQALATSATILQQRLVASGVKTAKVRVDSQGTGLTASVPASAVPTLRTTAATRGVLRFRQVLAWTGTAATAKPVSTRHTVTEATSLSPALLRTFARWNCQKNPLPTTGDAAGDYIIACATTPDGLTYLLAPAVIDSGEISGASDGIDETGQWIVDLTFDGKGSTAWQQVTAKTYAVDGGTADVGSATSSVTCGPPKGCNAVSITLDGAVVSAPYSETAGGIPGGQTQISGSFSQQQAGRLADVLKYGALPTTFHVATTS